MQSEDKDSQQTSRLKAHGKAIQGAIHFHAQLLRVETRGASPTCELLNEDRLIREIKDPQNIICSSFEKLQFIELSDACSRGAIV